MNFTVQGSTARLSVGETLFIPASTEFNFTFTSILAKAYVFSNRGGFVELMAKLGTEYEPALIPEKETDWDTSRLSAFEKELGYTLVLDWFFYLSIQDSIKAGSFSIMYSNTPSGPRSTCRPRGNAES